MIDCQDLTKEYGPLRAVDHISFQVKPGEVLGFLGPNGAGKTTTMRIIAGFLPATTGRVSVCGHDVETRAIEAKRCIGYLPEGGAGYPEMTARTFLEFVAEARNMPAGTRKQRLDEVFGLLHLEKVLDQTIDTLSKGYRRRVGLAQAILHDPAVLLLDEPTDGLDPNQKHEVRELIRGMAANKIIIISTHLLEEVGAICTRALVIAEGRIVADDTPDGLLTRSRFHNAVTFRLGDGVDLQAAKSAVGALPQVGDIDLDTGTGRMTAFPSDGQLPLQPVTQLAQERGWVLRELALEPGRLDEVFRSITGGASA